MEILTSTSFLKLEKEATAGLQFVSVAVLKLAAVSEDVNNVQLKYGPTCPTIFLSNNDLKSTGFPALCSNWFLSIR